MRNAIARVVAVHGGRLFWVNRSDSSPAMADCPDLIIILPPRVILVELKSWRRRITDGQRAVLELLAECPRAESFLVRSEPRDETETGYTEFVEWIGG